MKISGLIIGSLIISALLLQSCSSSRKTARRQAKSDTTTTIAAVPEIVMKDTIAIDKELPADEAALLDSYAPIWQQTVKFNTFIGKAQMTYAAEGMQQDFTAQFRVKKDEAIWISVTALGGIVNVARVLITPDTIKAVIYLQKEYVELPMSEVAKLLPVKVDFSNLQNLILGNPLVDVSNPVSFQDFPDNRTFVFQEEDKNQLLAYNKNDNLLRSNQLRATQADGVQQLIIQFSNYVAASTPFSTVRGLHILDNGKQVLVNMDFKSYSFNEPIEMPFSIPKSYRKKVF